MTEPSTVAGDPAATAEHDPLADAEAALSDALGLHVAEPPASPAPEPEPEPAAAVGAVPPEPEPAEPSKPDDRRAPSRAEIARRMARIRADEARLRARRAEIDASEQQLRARELEITRLDQLARSDPSALMTETARRAGVQPRDLYERLTRQHLQSADPAVAQALAEIERLRAEIDRDRTDAAHREKEAIAAAERAQVTQHHDRCARALTSIPSGPRAAEFPSLAALPPAWLERHARDAVAWAAEHAPETTVPELAKALDALIREDLEHIRQRLPTAAAPAAHGAPAEGQGQPGRQSPAIARAASRSQRAAPTATEAATTGGTERELTSAERLAQADDLLRSAISLD